MVQLDLAWRTRPPQAAFAVVTVLMELTNAATSR